MNWPNFRKALLNAIGITVIVAVLVFLFGLLLYEHTTITLGILVVIGAIVLVSKLTMEYYTMYQRRLPPDKR